MSNAAACLAPPPGRVHLGVDVGGTKMLVAAYTSAGRTLFTFASGPRCDSSTIGAHLNSVMARFNGFGEVILGLAVPGLIDNDSNIIECDVLPALKGWNPRQEPPYVAPRSVLNDGEAALVSIAAEEGPDSTLAAVGTGTALVAAFQVAGVRMRRSRPYSGELGYIPYGTQGRLDDYASGSALLVKLGVTADELVARLSVREPEAVEAVRQAGVAFGTGLATIVNLLHPERIGLYGGTLDYAGYLDAALKRAGELAHPTLRQWCRIEVMPDAQAVVANGALIEALRA